MIRRPTATARQAMAWLFLAAVGTFAVWARLWALGDWPLALDEYFLARSVERILQTGVPAFECGGWYSRGLLHQYLAAALAASGLSLELAVRGVSVAAELAALPALMLLAARLGPRPLGIAVAVLFALSVWETEFARFGRMYAVFQAIFLWYLWCLFRALLDGSGRARHAMLGLTVLATLTWEGGIFLAVLNLLPPGLDLRRLHWRWWLPAASLIVGAWVFLHTDFRGLADALPPGIEPARVPGPPGPVFLWTWASPATAWGVAAILIAGVSLGVGARFLRATEVPLAVRTGMAAAVVSAALNQLGLAAWLLLLTALWTPRGLARGLRGRGMWMPAAMALWGLFWVAFGLTTDGWREAVAGAADAPLRKLAVVLLKYPDVFDRILFEWQAVMPAATALAIGATGVLVAGALLRGPGAERRALRLYLIVLILLVLAVGAAPTTYTSTRYSFFLYPLVLLDLCLAGWWLAERIGRVRPALRLPAYGAILLAFVAASEDFGIEYFMRLGSYEGNFRVGLDPDQAEHLYTRRDVRGAAAIVNRGWRRGDVVIVTDVSFGRYLTHLDAVLRTPAHGEFAAVSCRQGRVERWTNAALIHDLEGFAALRRAARGRVWLVLPKRDRLPVEETLYSRYRDYVRGETADGQWLVLAIPPDARPRRRPG